ncbi:hypothetical protein BH24ACT5_BH24ACT5_17930 [soil metagenome]
MVDRNELEPRLQHGTIGGVRILLGLMWLANLHWKVAPRFGEDNGAGLYKYVAEAEVNAPFAPFRWIVDHIVLPQYQLFGWFTLVSESVVAALLLIGYRTREVALLGAGLSVSIFLSVIYYPRADEWSWAYFMMIGLHLLVAAVAAGDHVGVDGVLAGPRAARNRALTTLGVVGVVVGVLGLFVARSVDFAGRQAALLGSDAGFADGDRIVRRWELKFLWFNPLWALLTIAGGALLIAGAKQVVAAWAGASWFAALAIIIFISQTFDYARDDGNIQVVGTGSNFAFWGALATGAAVLTWRQSQTTGADVQP